MNNAQSVIDALTARIKTTPQLRGAWLKGSQVRGDADRHSDIDLHLWIEAAERDVFVNSLEAWLAELYPIVRYHLLHGGRMAGALLQLEPNALIGVGLFLESGDVYTLTPGHERVLYDRDSALTFKPDDLVPLEVLRRDFDIAVRYFWTLYFSLPSVERGEFIASSAWLNYLAAQLVLVCGLGRGEQRRVGEGRNNVLLSADERLEIERALALPVLDAATLVRAQRRMRELMQTKGRAAAAFLGAPYPEALEAAVLAHVQRELERQGL